MQVSLVEQIVCDEDARKEVRAYLACVPNVSYTLFVCYIVRRHVAVRLTTRIWGQLLKAENNPGAQDPYEMSTLTNTRHFGLSKGQHQTR